MLVECLHAGPRAHGQQRSRWTLALLLCLSMFAGLRSVSGVWRRLRKWDLGRKRSRDYLHSPDPQYAQKMARLSQACQQADSHPQSTVFLYCDEHTIYRQPLPGLAYHERGSAGRHQPLARRSYQANRKYRLLAVLDAVLGKVVYFSAPTIGVRALGQFLHQVRAAYGPGLTIYLAWDNWPVHAHPQVLQAAQQASIQVLFLPTYAPWTNPIEKLWNWLKQEVLVLHPYAHSWDQLQAQVRAFLDQFAGPSPVLLRYVGLAP